MNSFWHAVWVCLVVIPVTILWVVCMVDVIINRGDLVWWKRLGWLLLLLVPFFGPIIYALASRSPMFRRGVYDERIREERMDDMPHMVMG